MKLKLKMTLLTDTIFGNGISVPGGEDSSVLTDSEGFPYYKGGSFKGIFREELENYIAWQEEDFSINLKEKLGVSGSDTDKNKLRFYDFSISENVKNIVRETIQESKDDFQERSREEILDMFTYIRTFTKIGDDGMVSEGSLRSYRCIREGITFFGEMDCEEDDVLWVKEIVGLIKFIGTMRNRGFGKVKIEVI